MRGEQATIEVLSHDISLPPSSRQSCYSPPPRATTLPSADIRWCAPSCAAWHGNGR